MLTLRLKIALSLVILLLITIVVLQIYNIILPRRMLESFQSAGEKENQKVILLHENPDIYLIKNFLTEEECDYIIRVGEPHIKKSEVCGKNGSRPDKSRTSMTAHIGKKFLSGENKDEKLLGVLQKASDHCKLDVKNIEPIQLVRYEPGQYFKPHYDYLDRKIDIYQKNVDRNGQRKYTFFVYLTQVPKSAGGTTYFPKIDKHFSGGKGDAIFWDNILPDGTEDNRMLHSGTELKKGKKYGLNIWVRNKEYKG